MPPERRLWRVNIFLDVSVVKQKFTIANIVIYSEFSFFYYKKSFVKDDNRN